MGFIVKDSKRLWLGQGSGQKKGRIPFRSAFPDDSEEMGFVKTAIKHWSDRTQQLIRFERATDDEVNNDVSRIVFQPFSSGEKAQVAFSETIGRKGGVQWVKFDLNSAWSHFFTHGIGPDSTLIHEMGHVVGLFHEQVRPDRDKNIQVLWQNIGAVCKYCRHAYESKPCTSCVGLRDLPEGISVGPYDLESVMHYRQTQALKKEFEGTSAKTWVPWNPARSVGQAHLQLSAGDVATIQAKYR